MTRRIISKREQVALEFDKLFDKTPKRLPNVTKRGMNREIENINKRVQNDNWNNVQSRELVALYAWCHNDLYGVMPVEMKPRIWLEARRAAKRLVSQEFDNNMAKVIAFFRWVWAREANSYKWKISKGYEIRRISWKNMFIHDYLLTDYRVAKKVYEKNNK